MSTATKLFTRTSSGSFRSNQGRLGILGGVFVVAFEEKNATDDLKLSCANDDDGDMCLEVIRAPGFGVGCG